MEWKCKLCSLTLNTRAKLFTHYRLHHGSYSRVSPLPCLYDNCICTFPSFSAMKTHISRYHNDADKFVHEDAQVYFTCTLCDFKRLFSEATLFSHLRSHLRMHEMVECPFKNCNYRTNAYSSFNAHKSRQHLGGSDFDENVVSAVNDNTIETSFVMHSAKGLAHCEDTEMFEDLEDDNSQWDLDDLKAQLHLNLASLFLKMKTVLHVSDMATQEIVEHLTQLFTLSQPLIKRTIENVFQNHSVDASETLVNEIVGSVINSNIFATTTAKGEVFSSHKRRKTFIEKNFPFVSPVQYVIEPGHTTVHISVLQMIQQIFKHTDVLDKMSESKASQTGHYASHHDGSYFKDNDFFSSEELCLPLLLYIDDIEIANPLGTSRKIHKLSTIYWIFADLPSKHRSALHVIQLATLCKVSDLDRFGYERVLSPLLRDIRTLEEDGVFIESLGKAVRGSVMCVVSDNLAAHSLAGFAKSFRATNFCRFCTATQDQLQTHEVSDGEFTLRTQSSHDDDVQAVMKGQCQQQCGVKKDCVFNQCLEYFHTVTGFPPDVLHDLFEGIVPVELALCLGEMIRCKYFSLEDLNRRIYSFPYKHTDKVDRPQPIPKTFVAKHTIGGNGHENATLLRLLPLIVGDKIPEGDGSWSVLMDLKDIVELMLSVTFTEETIQYLQSKIQDHRQILQEVFPRFQLRPKHHYVEHYPHLIRCFGPLIHYWTMRFEGKHRFFKRVVHDTQNFKNVLKTLATRHQHMVAFYLSSPSFFKPHQQTSNVTSVNVSTLPDTVKEYFKEKTDSSTIYSTSRVNIDGTDFSVGMFVAAGYEGGLSQFCKIENIFLVDNWVTFLTRDHKSDYIEHLRSYALLAGNLIVRTISELNDTLPLSAYNIEGQLLLTLKRYILVN